ncbi:hypothetical protein SAMN04487949_0543 [Halogranum gelatinilyticum]|uniref:Big-1 domain-containing protein n=1 Tax=Halogranum gelatinilyticum TaxID=660521 RepID=A0A1G9PUL1_9EURY|nr:hypothetical protein [Halogranum gelatinilyticum]SDM02439.1 hypothetical protein SAMN04487949_0543 [Halogranum gelatinilyticum]
MHSRFTNSRRTEPHVASRRTTDRAVSPVIGGILMFGLVIAMVSLIQVTGVPVWNAQEEFHHSQAVQAEFQTLDQAVEDVAATGSSRSVVLDTGMDYPTRPFLFNPPPVVGQLQVDSAGDIGITNAAVVHNTNYWSKTATADPTFATSTVRYTPGYRQYQGAPETYYEHGVLYNRFADGTVLPASESNLVDGREISLVVLDGQLSTASSAPTTVELHGLSGPAQTTTITSRDSSGVVLTLPTAFDEATWLDLLGDQVDGYDPANPTSYDPLVDEEPRAYIADLDVTGGVLTLTMEPGSYDLRLAKVGVGNGYTDEPPLYVTAVDGDGSAVVAGNAGTFVAQVRDQFNNPTPGVSLTFSVDGTGTFVKSDGTVIPSSSVDVTTDANGLARVYFRPNGDVLLTAKGDLDDSGSITAREKAMFNVEFVTPVGDGYSEYEGSLNPVGSKTVILQQAERLSTSNTNHGTCTANTFCEIRLNFENLDTFDRNIEQIRVNFYSANSISNSEGDFPDYAALVAADGTVLYSPLTVGGSFVAVDSPGGANPIVLSDSSTTAIYLKFYYVDNTNKAFELEKGDFFALTIVYDNSRTGTYLVGIVDDARK